MSFPFYRKTAASSARVLLMAAFGVHFSLTGLGLVFYGPEGIATEPFTSLSFSLGGVPISAQSIIVVGATAACLLLFAVFFENSLLGKALPLGREYHVREPLAIRRIGKLG